MSVLWADVAVCGSASYLLRGDPPFPPVHSAQECVLRSKSGVHSPAVPSVTRRGLRLGGPRHHPLTALGLLFRSPIVFSVINKTVMEIPGVRSFYTFMAIYFLRVNS